jgi:hypothetical protein
MPDQVDIPKVGKVPKKYVIASVVLVGGYVAYRWYQASAATGEPDPFTPSVGEGGPDASGVVGAPAGGNTQYAGTVTDNTDPNKINTNDQWFNTAVERLSATGGWDAAAVQSALGEFLARRPLDESEQSIVRAAIGAAGEPPENRPWTVIPQVGPTTLDAPKNVRLYSNPTASEIRFQWDPVPGAISYVIYRAGVGESIGASFDTKYYAQRLDPGVSYSFQVKAVSSLGKQGPASATFTAKTSTSGLAAPTAVSVNQVTSSSAQVGWKAVPNATGYRVTVSSSKGTRTYDAAGTYVVARSLGSNLRHTAVVQARFSTAWGPKSSPVTFTTKR